MVFLRTNQCNHKNQPESVIFLFIWFFDGSEFNFVLVHKVLFNSILWAKL